MFRILGGPISICLSHLRMLCLYITSDYSAFPKFHARRAAFSEDLCRHLSHLRMTCLPFASQYLAFPTSRAGRPAFSEDLYPLFTYCRFVSLCTRNPGFHSSNPRSARALRLSRFRPSFRIVLADVCGCGPECRKTSLCAVFAKIVFSPTPNAKSNTKKIPLSNYMFYFVILKTPCSRLREKLF